MVPVDASKVSQQTEDKLTQHFVYLHGVLQNLEIQLKDRLYGQREALKKNVDALRDELCAQEDKLASAYTMALTARENIDRINLKKLTEKLMELAESPCHIVTNGNNDDQIWMEIDSSLIERLQSNHIQLHVPENPKFSLLRTNELPDDYELESIESDETLNASFPVILRRESPSPAPSSASRSSSANQSFEEPINAAVPFEPSSLARGLTDRVRMLHMNNPTDFYVLKKVDERIYQELHSSIGKGVENSIEPPSHVNLNSLYIVQNSMDLKWYRGRVTRKEQSGGEMLYNIFYIDLGIREQNVSVERMRKLSTGINIAPSMALQCSLDEIVPMEGEEWDEDSLIQFWNFVQGQTLHMTVLRTEGSKLIVDLKLFNGSEDISLREFLLATQRAKVTSYQKLKRMNPLSTHQFFYEEWPLREKYLKVKVLHVDSPNCIYVRNPKLSREVEEKKRFFQREYPRTLRTQNLSLKTPQFGSPIALEEASTYHRGYITDINSQKSQVEVFLVDTGETKVANYSQITRLPHRFREWNAQAMKVSLVDIEPADDEGYSHKATVHLQKNLTNKVVKVLPISKSGNAYNVAMLTTNETNVNAHLVSMKYAVSTGQYSKHATLNNDLSAPVKPYKKPTQCAKLNNQREAPRSRDHQSNKAIKPKAPIQQVEEMDPFRVRVLLNKVISPDEMYVSKATNVATFQAMNERMQKFYSENRAECEDELQPGLYYCVFSRKDNQYCRAVFLGMSEKRRAKAKMSLIDLAEVDEFDVDDIQPLNRRFLDCPKNMFRIKLAGISPCGGSKTWPSSSCRKLKEIIDDSGCDTKYYITLAGSAEAEKVIPVDLFIRRNVVVGPTEPNRRENISVRRRLIEDGHAFPVRGYDEEKEKELAIELKKKLKLDCPIFDSNMTFKTTVETSNGNLTTIEEEALTVDSNHDFATVVNAEINNDDKEIEEDEEDEEGEDDEETEEAEDENVKDEADLMKDTSNDLIPLPPKMENWIPAAHLLEDEFIAHVTHIGYDCEVYFHPDTKEYNETLEYIRETLDERYRNKAIKKYDTTWEVGDLCIVKYHIDNKWYRGQVIDVESKRQTVVVFFVDYGNTEDCQIGALKKRIALTEIPIQATKAAIAGIKPVSGKWAEKDLDIIHRVIVDKRVRVKVLSKPPKPWKVALWMIEGKSVVAVPWYIQNKTQVNCIVEDIISLTDAETAEFLNNQAMKMDSTIKAVVDDPDGGFRILTNGNDSDDTSEDESVSDNFQTVVSESDSDTSDTLKSGDNIRSQNITPMNQYSAFNATKSSSSFSSSSRKRSLVSIDSSDTTSSQNVSADLCNEIEQEDQNGNKEKLLSGNSFYLANDLDINFDIQSVRSEASNVEMNHQLVTSTPANTSFVEDNAEPTSIDFFMYKLRNFEMCIGRNVTSTKMSGYIVNCSNPDLNALIAKGKTMQEEIQIFAKAQPLLAPELGAFGIAKYEVDEQWYRAQIINMYETGFEVEFIDFGNCALHKDGRNFRAAKPKWLEGPRLSFIFKLHNVKIIPGLEKEARTKLFEILSEQPVWMAFIKEYEPVLGIELYFDGDCKELAYSSLIKDGLLEVINSEVD